MKNIKSRKILALTLVFAMLLCVLAAFCSCATKTEAPSGDDDTDTDTETRTEMKVLTFEEFLAMFEEIEITNDNIFDYFEITSDDDYYWLSPKEGILAYANWQEGNVGYYLEYMFDCTYDVEFYDGDTLYTTKVLTQSESGSSVYREGGSTKLSKKVNTPAIGKVVDGKYMTYKMTVKEINDFVATSISQGRYSVVKYTPKAEYYNDIDGEKVIFYKKETDGAVTSVYGGGITESGKRIESARFDEKNGKYYLAEPFFEGDEVITYDQFITEDDKKAYGDCAWFRTLCESVLFYTSAN